MGDTIQINSVKCGRSYEETLTEGIDMGTENEQENSGLNEMTWGQYFEVWKQYEKIAMHFNDLIIRLRTQSIGGLAALAAIIGIVLKNNEGGDGAFS